MASGRHINARDNQVFLIMGVNEDNEEAECAIVLACDQEAAKRAFVRTYEGSVPMTWPSLQDIKLSVEMMETARRGGFPDDVMVINDMG